MEMEIKKTPAVFHFNGEITFQFTVETSEDIKRKISEVRRNHHGFLKQSIQQMFFFFFQASSESEGHKHSPLAKMLLKRNCTFHQYDCFCISATTASREAISSCTSIDPRIAQVGIMKINLRNGGKAILKKTHIF